jgi:NAD(P)-dependent dehydrogenase (short-subunit alcohol dehydrogenase family)
LSVLDRFRLDGRVAFITGGSKGLGEAMALGFSEAGAKVVITSRHADECEETAQRVIDATGGEVLALEGDVTDKAQVHANVAEAVAAYGGVDILVNNAGTNVRVGTVDLALEDWQRIVDVNLTGPFLCGQAVLPIMIEKGYGRIINLSSIFGAVGFPERTPYTATKGGLLNMTRAWALEFAKDGITVNALCPGPFDTPMNRPLRDDPEVYQKFVAKIPMGRWGDLEELASTAVFLASDASSYVTGSALFVDGGWTAQ